MNRQTTQELLNQEPRSRRVRNCIAHLAIAGLIPGDVAIAAADHADPDFNAESVDSETTR